MKSKIDAGEATPLKKVQKKYYEMDWGTMQGMYNKEFNGSLTIGIFKALRVASKYINQERAC